ncbi:MAG: ribosomal-protein-alanine N-acetyltransferase [Parvicellaceae bacterium]|jgi:ribosomal-protein-alanine N-acetyltransferase
MINQFPNLRTKRLSLRAPQTADGPEVLMLRSDEIVNQFVKRPKPANLVDAVKFIDKLNGQYENDASIYWVINSTPNTKMIGSICLWNFSEDRKTAELGYDLHPDYYSQGIMTEAMNRIVEFGFDSLQLNSIEAFTQDNNVASIKLLEKNDFVLNPTKKDVDNLANLIFELHRP